MKPTRILFVCLGNICRSPAAEAVMRALAPRLLIDSAGTGDWHIGKPPHLPMQRAAAARGHDLSALRARQVTAQDFHRFDLILGMDAANVADLESIRPPGAATPVARLLDHAPQLPVRDVPDPYFTGDYEEALDLIEAGCTGLLRGLQRQ